MDLIYFFFFFFFWFCKIFETNFCASIYTKIKTAINQFSIYIYRFHPKLYGISCVALQIDSDFITLHESERQLKDKNVPLIAIIKLQIISLLAIGIYIIVFIYEAAFDATSIDITKVRCGCCRLLALLNIEFFNQTIESFEKFLKWFS